MKKFIALALSCMLLVGMTACGGSSKNQLVLSTYGLSEDISAEEVYGPFEEQADCEIVTETGTTNERYTKLSANANAGIDVIELSQALTAQGADEGLFAELDLSKIPNAENLIGPAKELAENGQGIAYTINSVGIVYDREACGMEITSFDDLWDAALEGKIAIPDITTTFGPAMVYIASDHAGVDITTDNGAAAFEQLAALKPNIVKTYSKSSDLVNMFTSGEITAAIIGDFGVPVILGANPELTYVSPTGTYANFNLLNIPKNAKNMDLAYEYINYRLSEEVQKNNVAVLNEAPTNSTVTLTDEEAATLTYGDTAENARVLDFTFVNAQLESWIDQWNRTLNS